MIRLPNNEELAKLKSYKKPHSISIYIPFIEPSSAAAEVIRIELKNLLREARESLKHSGLREIEVEKTIRPADELVESGSLWRIKHEAVAIFLHDGNMWHFHLPREGLERMITVDASFNIEPLEKIVKNNKEFYILALGRKNARLLHADKYHIEPIDMDDFPSDMEKALGIDEYPRWIETHSVARGDRGRGSESFHGQYNKSETDKIMLLDFFRKIDRKLKTFFINNKAPLVIAGVDYLLPIYRRANTYSQLVPKALHGNFERASLPALHKAANRIIS